MLRTFVQHRVRATASLNGLWEFTIDPPRKKVTLPRQYDRTILVPSAWETMPGLESYRGKGWLRTAFEAEEGYATRLVFGGVSHTGDVYVDGRHVAHHYDAFTPWDVVLPDLREGARELVVAVDNTFGPHSALHIPNDYYTYGGITRPVEVQHVPAAYLHHVHATPWRAKRSWSLEIEVEVRNWSDRPCERTVRLAVADAEYELDPVTVPPRDSVTIEATIHGIDAEPWSHESPRLYELTAVLLDGEEIVDDLIDRIGFRTVEVRGKKLLLSGEPIRLRGYNRHEDHHNFGCAIPLEAMVQDLNLIRDLGCNFVRTCHYPNDMRFLDLCDELGIYVWEESHARTVDMEHPKFREQIEASTREMVAWHRNRPSIVIWGCLNECETRTEDGRDEHARVLKLIKELDASRPVTYASMFHENDLAFGLADIVSVNRYVGWYGSNLPEVEPALKRFLKWLHSDASRGGKGKPVILSEFGGGAIPGYFNRNRVHWTEEYLSDLLDHELGVYLNHPDVVGAAVWQFCDVRVTPEGGWWQKRPRTMNNKGSVDQFRQPKLCYDTVKRRMLEAKAKWKR